MNNFIGKLILIDKNNPFGLYYESILGIYINSSMNSQMTGLVYHDILDCQNGKIRSYCIPSGIENNLLKIVSD